MIGAGREGRVITKVKHIEVASKDKLLPSQVVKLVDVQVPFNFNMNLHTEMWKRLGVRPPKNAKDPERLTLDTAFTMSHSVHTCIRRRGLRRS
jgi:hypothetical protein